uniref:Uncharacterized protein n=1 Tax=Anopheles atroparvus TaxID=41427 RepID=A0A182IZS7_ANOAO
MESCLRGYVRRSWAMRFICLALPVLINLRTGRTVDSVHGKPSNSILTRDCSSAIFMLSAGLLLSRWLEANIRFYEDRSETKERTESEAKNFETMMIGFVKNWSQEESSAKITIQGKTYHALKIDDKKPNLEHLLPRAAASQLSEKQRQEGDPHVSWV